MTVSRSDTRESPADVPALITLASQGRHPNVLFVRNGTAAGEGLEQLLQACAQPLHVATLPGELRLPSATNGTLVLNDVSALTPVQQATLNEWLEAVRPRVQIISITSTWLGALVDAGQFDPTLFYRLNVIHCGPVATAASANIQGPA